MRDDIAAGYLKFHTSEFAARLNPMPVSSIRKRICIVTSSHISYNPRLLKEADTLAEAGYGVRAVGPNVETAKGMLDRQLMSRRTWELQTYDSIKVGPWLLTGIRQKTFANLWKSGLKFAPELAHSRYDGELTRVAGQKRADLFIAHTLQALPAAARAARRWHAKLGFDAEDFHRGELLRTRETERQLNLVEWIEQKYIPRCDYVTAASGGIANEYTAALGIQMPTTILNVFPLAERSGHTPLAELTKERKADGLSLYWYSQVIGPGRGLDDALRATALLKRHVQLHLRGGWAFGYREVFEEKIKQLRIEDLVYIHAPVPPEELVERAAQHDVGLALEPGRRSNNAIAASNKLFTYMLAGLACAITDVPGQRAIYETAPKIGFLYRSGDASGLASALSTFIVDPGRLERAKHEALQQAQTRYCWEIEKTKFLRLVEQVIGVSPSGCR